MSKPTNRRKADINQSHSPFPPYLRNNTDKVGTYTYIVDDDV